MAAALLHLVSLSAQYQTIFLLCEQYSRTSTLRLHLKDASYKYVSALADQMLI